MFVCPTLALGRLSGSVRAARTDLGHWLFARRSYEDDTWEWEGFVIEYIQKLRLMTLDTPWPMEAFTFTFTSGASRAKHASTFDACVNDVQNGLVDMCAGSFWMTDVRLEMASFTKPIYEEDHILFVPKRGMDTKETFAVMANKAFRVFDSSLWLMVLSLNIFIGWVDAWMNKDEWRSDKWQTFSITKKLKVNLPQPPGAHSIPPACTALTACEAAICLRPHVPVSSLRGTYHSNPSIQVTCVATFNGMMRYTFDIVGGGVDAVEAHCISWPNKCVRLGWGIFILILLSSYTANLAAFLTATAGKNTTLKNINDAIEKGVVICTHLVVTGQVNEARVENPYCKPRLFPHEARRNQKGGEGGPPSLKRVSVPVPVVVAGLGVLSPEP